MEHAPFAILIAVYIAINSRLLPILLLLSDATLTDHKVGFMSESAPIAPYSSLLAIDDEKIKNSYEKIVSRGVSQLYYGHMISEKL